MAGDWIKMRTDLWDHPKVVRIVSAICPQSVRDLSARCRVIGALYRTWSLADCHSSDGILDGYTAEALDAAIGIEGWAENMQHVGWLIVEAQRLIVPRFEEHNGVSAKRRADDAARKKRVRKTSAECPQTNGQNADQRRVEKRRVLRGKPLKPQAVTIEALTIPASLDTQEVRDAIAEWIEYKRKRRESYKEPAHLDRLLAEFAPFGPMQFVQSVSYAIARNYAGLPEPNRGRAARVGAGQSHDPEASKKDPNYGRM
jgi:hypothetical protein